MSGSPTPHRQPAGQSDIYWRRRVGALAVGIAVSGLAVWALNTAISGTAGPAADAAQVTSEHSPASYLVQAGPEHGPVAEASPAAGLTPKPTRPAGQAGAGTSATGRAAAGQVENSAANRSAAGQRNTAASSAACPAGDVVLSLFDAKDSYATTATPKFQVDVVSAAPAACMFDLGPKNVQVLIKSGATRIWDSADCAASASPRPAELARGVPAVLRVSWDRRTSAAGCRAPRTTAAPGTYSVTAYSGTLRSQTLTFTLRSPASTAP